MSVATPAGTVACPASFSRSKSANYWLGEIDVKSAEAILGWGRRRVLCLGVGLVAAV